MRLMGGAGSASATVVCPVTVIEGPGELIRQAHAASVEKVDAAASLATLLGYAQNAGAKVRVVGDCFVESLSGEAAKSEAVCEYKFPLTDHYRSRVSTNTYIPHHHARLIHLWKPTGKPEFEKDDVLQVMFMTCDVMRDGGVE